VHRQRDKGINRSGEVHRRPFSWQFNKPEFRMKGTLKSIVTFLKREDGPTAVEYAVMLALIVVVCIATITAIGQSANQTFSTVGSAIKPS